MESQLSFLLPTLNERDNIVPQIEEIFKAVPTIGEIIIVDDDSQDGTRDVIKKNYADLLHSGKVKLIHRTKDLGLTNSLKEGVMASTFPLVGWMDCDLSMPAPLITSLAKEIAKGADIAIGSRFAKGGEQKSLFAVQNDSRAEILLSTVLNKFLRLASGAPVTDFTSGFIVAKKTFLETFRWRGSHGEYFIYLMADAHLKKKKIVEIGYTCGTRRHGASKTFGTWKATYRNSLRYSATVLNVLRAKVIRF